MDVFGGTAIGEKIRETESPTRRTKGRRPLNHHSPKEEQEREGESEEPLSQIVLIPF